MRKPTALSGPFIGFCVFLRLILARYFRAYPTAARHLPGTSLC